MAFELLKTLEGHEVVMAVVVAFLVTAFMIVTGRKRLAVNPGMHVYIYMRVYVCT